MKTKSVEIQGIEFEICELTIGQMIPLLPRLSGNEDATEATLDLMKLSIHRDGEPLGDSIQDLGISTYMELTDHVLEVNGLGGLEGNVS